MIRAVALGVVALVMFVEEWGWRPLTAWAARLARWAPLAAFEAWLRQAPPWVALLMFGVPGLTLFPIKLMALGLMHRGHAALAVCIIVLVKLLGTALVGRLFIVVEPQLMQFPWLARAIRWWRRTRAAVAAWVRASAFVQIGRLWAQRVRTQVRLLGRMVRRWIR